MKKGCFITSVVLFTIIVGVIVYFVKYKKDFIKEFSKDKIVNLALNEFDEKLNEVKISNYRDSLKNKIHSFFRQNSKAPFDSAMKRIEYVMDEARYIIRDGIIDSTDFDKFKTKLALYERSKKN